MGGGYYNRNLRESLRNFVPKERMSFRRRTSEFDYSNQVEFVEQLVIEGLGPSFAGSKIRFTYVGGRK